MLLRTSVINPDHHLFVYAQPQTCTSFLCRVLGAYQQHRALRSLLQCQIQEFVCRRLSVSAMLVWRDKVGGL